MAVAEIIEYPKALSDWVATARSGVPKSVLDALAAELGVKTAELAPLLHISARTLQRQSAEKVLPPQVSERVLMILRVYERACEVFDEPRDAATWLRWPNRALGGQTPLGLLDTVFGAEQLTNILGRIEHGVFS